MLKKYLNKAVDIARNRKSHMVESARVGDAAKTLDIAADPILSVKEYDKAEADGTLYLSVPHLMAYKPVSYQLVG